LGTVRNVAVQHEFVQLQNVSPDAIRSFAAASFRICGIIQTSSPVSSRTTPVAP
jgi:hypothetical protein